MNLSGFHIDPDPGVMRSRNTPTSVLGTAFNRFNTYPTLHETRQNTHYDRW